MLSAYSAALVACALLAVPEAAAPPEADAWGPEFRRIHLSPRPQGGPAPEVRVSPGASTVLVFDTPVARQELPGEERFGRVRLARDTLMLLPGARVEVGETWTLTVHFADGAVPARAELRLVVHAALAERQVAVYRHPRSAEDLQGELLEKAGQVERCQAALSRLEAAHAPLDRLSGWLDTGLLDTAGVLAGSQELTEHPRNALRVEDAWTYRAAGRAVVALVLKLPKGPPWDAGSAILQAKAGPRLRVLRVWPHEPIAPGQARKLYVDVEVSKDMLLGPYTLTVEEAGGTRALTVGNLMFF